MEFPRCGYARQIYTRFLLVFYYRHFFACKLHVTSSDCFRLHSTCVQPKIEVGKRMRVFVNHVASVCSVTSHWFASRRISMLCHVTLVCFLLNV